MAGAEHTPVMLEQVRRFLSPRSGGIYVDGTVGGGGHAEEILRCSGPDSRLIGCDRDAEALEAARKRLERYGSRVILHHADYRSLPSLIPDTRPDGILIDLGLSSLQLLESDRGFSFRRDGPLDMRFDRRRTKVTAAELLNTLSIRELTAVLRRFGEEPQAKAIARAIDRHRNSAPIRRTVQLAEIVHSVKTRRGGKRTDPATQTFQALRIAVNGELEGLGAFLESAAMMLAPGGVLVVVAYHSLEDRIVKKTFSKLYRPCSCPPDLPVCGCGAGEKETFILHTRRVVTPDTAELEANPKSRSARLRSIGREDVPA